MGRYSDGGIFTIPITAGFRIPIAAVSRIYDDQYFTLVLLNRGGTLITVTFTPLLGNPQVFEVPTSSPGVVLDYLSYEEFVNGLTAIADTAPSDLQLKLYSNDITYSKDGGSDNKVRESMLYPRDSHKYGVLV